MSDTSAVTHALCEKLAELQGQLEAQKVELERVRSLLHRTLGCIRDMGWDELEHDILCYLGGGALASPAAELVSIPDGVHEALQRLIESAATLGPATREDALLVATYRRQILTRPAPVAQSEYQVTTYGDNQSRFIYRPPLGVQIRHTPTGLTVRCDSERTQHINRAKAMDELRALIVQSEKENIDG